MIAVATFLLAGSLLGELGAAGEPETPVRAVAVPVSSTTTGTAESDKPVAKPAPKAAKPVKKAAAAAAVKAAPKAASFPKADVAEVKPVEKAAPASNADKPAKAEPVAKAGPKSEIKVSEGPRSVRITSDRTDYDRKEGVIMFDRNVFVEDPEYKMRADQLYVFLDGTNDLKRIVAIGNVAITNEARVGTCAKAAYSKVSQKIVMYGDDKGKTAKLVDEGKRRSEVEGRKITFWIDSEQVEVEGSTVTLDAGGFGGKDGAKKLLGK